MMVAMSAGSPLDQCRAKPVSTVLVSRLSGLHFIHFQDQRQEVSRLWACVL